MKRIKIFLIMSAVIALFAVPNFVKADDFIKSADFIALPSETTAPTDSLNSTSNSFRVNVELSDLYRPDEIRLYLDGCSAPIDWRNIVGSSEYFLDSGEDSLPELKTLLGKCLMPVEGAHTLEVRGLTGLVETTIWQKTISADFTSPVGTFITKGVDGKDLLKVGDKVEITYNTKDPDILGISSKIYDRELTWTKDGGVFTAIYIIQEGDPDQINSLPLSDVVVNDSSLNQTKYGDLILTPTFSIDANSPQIQITNLKDVYSTDHLDVAYLASGYDSIKFYLNGQPVNNLNLSNLTTGNYVVKIVATDLAGNSTSVEKQFSIDLTSPAVTINSFPQSITEGGTATLSGQTEPNSEVFLYLNDLKLKAIADANGKFSFELKDLSAGNYALRLELFDQYGNKTVLDLGLLVVKEKPVEVVVVSSVKVAKAPTNNNVIDQGAPPVKKAEPVVASAGRIISSSDERSPRDYTSWFILAGLLIFSFAISSAGYYGLSWINISGGRNKTQTIEISEETFENKISPETSSSEIPEEDKPERNLRW